MNFNKSRIVVTTVILLSLVVTGVATAQDNSTTATPNEPSNESVILEIDEEITLVDYEFTDDGTAKITVYSEGRNALKLSDMFVASEGASNVRTKLVEVEGRSTVEMDTTAFKGLRGVSVASTDGTIAITDDSGWGEIFPGQYSGETMVIFSIISGVVGVTTVVFAFFKREQQIENSVERYL